MPGVVVEREALLRVQRSLDCVKGGPQLVIVGDTFENAIGKGHKRLVKTGQGSQDADAFFDIVAMPFGGRVERTVTFLETLRRKDDFVTLDAAAIQKMVEMAAATDRVAQELFRT